MTKNKKILLGLFAVEALLVVSCVKVAMDRVATIKRHKNGSIVRLYNFDGYFVCSGTVTNARTVITAAHCLAGASRPASPGSPAPGFEVRGADGKPTGVISYLGGYNGQADQAVLFGNFKAFDTRNIITDPRTVIKLFENSKNLMTCGYPYGGELFCLPINNPKQFLFQFKATGYLYPGMSGGPVIDKDTGSVIAVNTGAMITQDDSDTLIILSPTIEIFASTNTETVVK